LTNPKTSKQYPALAFIMLCLAVYVIEIGGCRPDPPQMQTVTMAAWSFDEMQLGEFRAYIHAKGDIQNLNEAKSCVLYWHAFIEPDDFHLFGYSGGWSRFELIWNVSYDLPLCAYRYASRGATLNVGEEWVLKGAGFLIIYTPDCPYEPKTGGAPLDTATVDYPPPPEITPYTSGPDDSITICNNSSFDIEIFQIEATTTGQTLDVPLDSLFFGNSALESLPFSELLPPGTLIPAGDSARVDIPEEPISGNYYCKIAYREVNSPYEPIRVVYKTKILEAPIPTLTEWGMIILGVLLLGWMARVIARRRGRAAIHV
jgi:hypothetical protein